MFSLIYHYSYHPNPFSRPSSYFKVQKKVLKWEKSSNTMTTIYRPYFGHFVPQECADQLVLNSSVMVADVPFSTCWWMHRLPAGTQSHVIHYQTVITKVNCNLVSWRAEGCERSPSDVEPYPRLSEHVTPNASCVTVNNPVIVKPQTD